MRLAFFTSIITDGNPTSGYEIANEAIVEGLRSLGHEISVFGFRLPRQKIPEREEIHVLETKNLENSGASSLKKMEWLLRAQLNGLPVAAAKLKGFSSASLGRVIEEFGQFDGHIINSYQMAAAFPELLKTPYIYVAHNVEHRSARENAKSAASILERYLYRRDERLLRKLEARLCDQASFVWALSDEDLSAHMGKKSNGCILPLVAPRIEGVVKNKSKYWEVGLIGTWSWQPNFVGLLWFLNEVVPVLPNDYRIAIAGGVPEGLEKTYPTVEFLGRVESANDFLESVRVVSLISQGGTGVQLKTIEAFQAGYLCVATTSSLRGVEVLPKNCLKADNAETFSKALVSLISRSREGSLQEIDGQEFYNGQLKKMKRGLKRGLEFLA